MTNFLNRDLFMIHFRMWICAVLTCLISFSANAQGGNKKPKITGQEALTTNEEQSVTIQMTQLTVEDRDDWFYPWGFSMELYPGTDYSLNGNVVIPNLNFSGTLKVPVTVNDGQDDSDTFNLSITVEPVNDKPVITGHAALTTNESQPITIKLDHLTVTDPDDSYPNDFSLKVLSGDNYTTNGNEVTPQASFTGVLTVNVAVNDGTVDSDSYRLAIQVNAVNRIPEIISQEFLQVNEDASITIQLSQLTVVDQDSKYPDDFSFTLSPGVNYTLSNATVTPAANFSGKVTVPVTVTDGKNTSKPFNLTISVIPANDAPVITQLETEPLYYSFGGLTAQVSKSVTVSDPDGDSIMYAEVGIRTGGYNSTFDRLAYTPSAGSKVRGVFDAGTGTLTLLGQASPSAYQQALRSVFYSSTVAQPSGNKTLYFIVNDGKSDSGTSERSLINGEATVALEIPSGFTPNGDSANDTWRIIPVKNSEEYTKARVRVYNKAGSVVYETVGFQNEWDGRLNGQMLPADTYFYTIDLNLQTPQGFVKGVVTILR